jgi:hypothetical protein
MLLPATLFHRMSLRGPVCVSLSVEHSGVTSWSDAEKYKERGGRGFDGNVATLAKQLRETTISFTMAVRPHVTRLSVDGFTQNLILGTPTEICRHVPLCDSQTKTQRTLAWRSAQCLVSAVPHGHHGSYGVFWRDNVFGFDLIRGVWLWKLTSQRYRKSDGVTSQRDVPLFLISWQDSLRGIHNRPDRAGVLPTGKGETFLWL